VTGGIAASRNHQAVERSREFTHSLFNSCSAGCLGTRLLSRSAARDPANSVRIARGMGAPSAANPAADRTEPVQLISTKNGRVVPRGGPSKRTTTNALSCLNLPKHFPYRKRFISASSTAMRLSRSARAASTSAASKRCGMCCEQFAASLSTRRRFRLLGFAPNLDTSPVCIVHPGLLHWTVFHCYRNRPADLQNGSNPNGGYPPFPRRILLNCGRSSAKLPLERNSVELSSNKICIV
jgi:hypothetical protein